MPSIIKTFPFAPVYILTLLFFPSLVYTASDTGDKPTKVIIGAGAHFAWVIFDELKEELEQATGKKLQLYGKNSSLGMGCNAGIKLAQQYSHSSPTFGFICCSISQHEREKKKIKIYPVADEPILILVNKNNPVKNLSAEQVRAIFRGDITNWKDVGGWDRPVVIITRLHCKKRPGHWKTILASADAFTKKRINVSSANEMVKMVTKFDTAIGHIGSTWVFSDRSHVKAIRINNVSASAENLKSKSYPFYRTLSAVTSMSPSEDILTTIKRVQHGKSFDAVAKKYNLLPLNAAATK
ncbi:Phosphate ABC transporter, periplasmic phosphate-binding protein PstS (TC 3.A.1.7.1) [hydrothermal vent metagenome]|uniref:Phosphate ABC transporter, periplasmic phosphate-binding protein PstS (TC 3.A.1.7.1) n=1 Tax=hydrothermal vent metagenome TaxID=652676 RepID=A0A3B0ZYR6_9ZZZZ